MSKTASAALISFLGSGQPFIGADLYVFKLYSGQTIYVTSLDRNVTYTGIISTNPDFGTHTYVSLGQTGSGAPMIQRSKLSMAVGLTPSKVDLEIFAKPGILIANQEILVTMAHGLWANAAVFIRRAFLLPSDQPLSWDTPWPSNLGGAGDGTIVWFAGAVGRIDELGPLSCKFQVRDKIWTLNKPQPHRIFGACTWNLFDAGCTLIPSSFQASGSVLSGSTTTVINTGLTNDASQPGAPVYGSNPLSQASTDYTLPATTYFAVATYITNFGETIASAEWFINCTPNKLITLASPPSVAGALGWNAYISAGSSGDEQLQNGSPIPIGTSWPEPTDGIFLTGILAPQIQNSGWWALGTITITYNVGALSGQTASAVVEGSNAAGQLSLRVPLPQTPSTSDSFVVFPGCSKSQFVCSEKFTNLVHFGGQPYVPVPESGA